MGKITIEVLIVKAMRLGPGRVFSPPTSRPPQNDSDIGA
ncbi:hypothetical protein DVDV_3880 [Desulfovibrio sp. DV]|nr:hypothetical protein DVDV_3880 [Desulfovibrio sp. DV]